MLKVTANENKTILVRFVIVSLLFGKLYKFIFQTKLSLLLYEEVYHLEPLFYSAFVIPIIRYLHSKRFYFCIFFITFVCSDVDKSIE